MKNLIQNQKGVSLIEVALVFGIFATFLVGFAGMATEMENGRRTEVVDLAPSLAYAPTPTYAPHREFTKEEADALIAQYGAPVRESFEREVARSVAPSGSVIGKAEADALIAQYGAQAAEAPVSAGQPSEIAGLQARGDLTLGGIVSGQVFSASPKRFSFVVPAAQDVRLKLETEGDVALSGVDLDLKVISPDGWTKARLMQIGNEDSVVRLDAGVYEAEVSLALGSKASFNLTAQPAN